MCASRSSLGVLGALIALANAGCNGSGIMELELLLPPAPTSADLGECGSGDTCAAGTCAAGRCIYSGEWYSQVEITSQFDFVDPTTGEVVQWDLGEPGRLDAIPLPAAGTDRWSCTSVVGTRTIERVRVRLRYCRSLPCVESLARDSVEHWYDIESPFYDGKRTHVRRRLPVVVLQVDRCETASDCASVLAGPECVGGGNCGCRSDAQCPSGHCEGVATEAGEGRCTNDIPQCRVSGCIVTDPLLETNDICLTTDAGVPVHPCVAGNTVDYGSVDCYAP